MFKLILIVLLIIGSFTECGKADPPRPTPPPAQKAEVKTEAPKTEQICPQAGLGDTLEAWVACYGKPFRDNGTLKNFRSDDIVVVFADNRAVNISFQNTALGTVPPYAGSMYPKDAKYNPAEEANDGVIRKVTKTGRSDLLQKYAPKTEGKFVVITQYDAKTDKYLGTTAGYSRYD